MFITENERGNFYGIFFFIKVRLVINLNNFYVLILIVYSKSLLLWEIYLFHICIAVLFFPSVADRFIVFGLVIKSLRDLYVMWKLNIQFYNTAEML